jgi:hypothetical protein
MDFDLQGSPQCRNGLHSVVAKATTAIAAMPLDGRVGFFLRCRLASHSADASTGGASCVGLFFKLGYPAS